MIVSEPVTAPTAVGENTTLMVQVVPAAKVVPQVPPAVARAKTVGEKHPTYRYEREVEDFFRHSPAVIRND